MTKAFTSELVSYVDAYFRENGLHFRSVRFLANAPAGQLPSRYAIFVTGAKQEFYCVWAEPESWTDLLDSVDDWMLKILQEARSLSCRSK